MTLKQGDSFFETFIIRNESGKVDMFLSCFVYVYVAGFALAYGTFSSLPKLASALAVPLAMIFFMVRADVKAYKKFKPITLMMVAYLFVLLAFSLYIWVANLEKSTYIISGSEKIVYQLINVVSVICGAYVFGEKNVKLTFYSVCLAELYYIVYWLGHCGLKASIDSVVQSFACGLEEKTGFFQYIEINDVTYVFAFYALYFLFMDPGSRKSRFWHAFVALFFLMAGYKRIGALAIAASLAIGFIFYKIPDTKRRRWVWTIAIASAVIALGYIPFVRYGALQAVMDYFDINMSTRDKIYAYIARIYDFTPTFRGYGFDYVTRYIDILNRSGVGMDGVGVKKLHSDLLVQYIELGFFGYLFFLGFNCIFLQHWWESRYGSKAAFLYMLINIFNLICYTTDNTCYSYQTTLAIRVVMLGAMLVASRKMAENTPDNATAPPKVGA